MVFEQVRLLIDKNYFVSSVYNFVLCCLPNVYISRKDRKKEFTQKAQSVLIILMYVEFIRHECFMFLNHKKILR